MLRCGISFPVVARISFGVMGANLAAVVRGVVGNVWYGVQIYFASKAVEVLVITLIPSASGLTHNSTVGLSTLGWFSHDGGWNHKALIALAASGVLSIGLLLLGTYGVIFTVGDWGWFIGASASALIYRSLSQPQARLMTAGAS